MKILIIGGGNMGKTFVESFVANHTVLPENLYILEHYEEKANQFRESGFAHSFTEPGEYIREMDLIILAIKPQDREALYPTIVPFISAEQLVLTIMAGVTIKSLKEVLPTSRILRAMPNLPAQIGMGMSGFTADPSVSKEGLIAVQNLLNTTGKSIYFEEEAKLDAVTAISGSGPAYVYYFMDAMIHTAQEMGFTQPQAELLVEQTFMGAVHLLNLNTLSCRDWIGKVSSRGGTTEAAVESFKQSHLEEAIGEGLKKAHERAIALGGG
ncbi:pyrroline-5-carboxylate reductase [soil metagenome]